MAYSMTPSDQQSTCHSTWLHDNKPATWYQSYITTVYCRVYLRSKVRHPVDYFRRGIQRTSTKCLQIVASLIFIGQSEISNLKRRSQYCITLKTKIWSSAAFARHSVLLKFPVNKQTARNRRMSFTLIFKLSSSKMFSNFKSRCTMPFWNENTLQQ